MDWAQRQYLRSKDSQAAHMSWNTAGAGAESVRGREGTEGEGRVK